MHCLGLHGLDLRRAQAPNPVNRQASDDTRDVSVVLQQLCRAAARDLDLAGATVTLIPQVGAHLVAASSDDELRCTEELQFDTGEGPIRDAFDSGHPVIAANLENYYSHWPGYVPAALAAGVCAAFAFRCRWAPRSSVP